VIVARPRNAEQAFEMAEHACRWQDIALVVVDSANHLVRQRELDGDPDYVPHPQREYKDELSSLKRAAKASGTVVLFVSQPRDKQREPIRGTGISEKVKYRVHLHPDVVHQDGSRVVQATVRDVPARKLLDATARFTVVPGKGIDRALELVHEAVSLNVVYQNGSWYHWPCGVSAHGAHEMAAELSRQPRLMHDVEMEIRRMAGIS
jgi:RecA/RadA recombinase